MPVYLDVGSRVDRRAVEATASEFRTFFNRLGAEISTGLGGSMSKALGAFDASATRAELARLERSWTRAADVEAEAALRMEASARRVEVAQARAAEMTERYTASHSRAIAASAALADAQANAARDQRAFTDAMVANEAAHQAHTRAMEQNAAAVGLASRAWNAAGVGSLAAFGAALGESTRMAGDFQQSQQRLVSSAGETSQNLKAVSDGILQLAGQVGYSLQELSNGMYTVEKAGYRGADGVNVLRSAAQLAKAENADLREVLNGLTTSMHDFGYGPEHAAEVASKMNVAVGEAKTNLQEFSGALHAVEPIAAAAGLKLEDVYGSLAQITQSGTSAEQGAQNMAHSISQLLKPTQQMRDEMAALGIDFRDVQAHLGERGFAGTVQMLSDTIRQHMSPAGQVVIDTMFKSQQATDSAKKMFEALSPAAQAVARAILDNSEAYKQFRKDRGGLSVLEANEIEQWYNIEKKVAGFSQTLKSGQGDVQNYEQALALMTGGQDSLRTVLQLVGENAESTNEKIRAVKDTTAETDGTVKGFNETQETLNAKMADAKAAFGTAATELGSAFVPVITEVAKGAKWVGDEFAKHPAIAQDVTIALGALGGAWLLIKSYDIATTILSPIGSALGALVGKFGAVEAAATTASTTMRATGAAAAEGAAGVEAAAATEVAAEQRVAASAAEANAAMAAGGGAAGAASRVGLGAAAATAAGEAILPTAAGNAIANDIQGTDHGWTWAPSQAIDLILHPTHWGERGHAHGGAVHGRGPKGIDSVPTWLAPGEHVLTHLDVAAMGGHSGVYAFRNALHRATGGEIGPDVQAARSMQGTAYSQGARNDCSGMVGRVILGAMGLPATNLPTTKNMGQWLAALGFQPGIGGPGSISVGWYDHGPNPNDGHAAMTLSNGENAEAGGSHDNFVIGAGAAGAASPQFDQHMFLPTLYGEGAATGMPGFAAGMGAGGFGGMGGGIPPGATPGTGPGGQPGYYTANPQRVAAAEERLRHIDAEIANAEERRNELKATASKSQRDRLDEEIRHLQTERAQEQERLAEAQRGTFHAMRGGRGGFGGGMSGLPVPLPENFGLNKGLPGLAEWAVGFLSDLALGPLEAGITGAMQRAGFPAPGSHGSGLLGIIGDLTDQGGVAGGGALGPLTGGPLGGPTFGGDGVGSLAAGTAAGGGGSGGGAGSGGAGGGGAAPLAGRGAGGEAGTSSYWWTPGSRGGAAPAPPGAAGRPGSGQAWPDLPPPWFAPLNPAQARSSGPAGMPYSSIAPKDFDPSRPGDPFSPEYRASGGPVGSDTVPAWLTPGEFVMNQDATRANLPALQAMNAAGRFHDGGMIPQYWAPGTDQPVAPGPQPAPKPQPQQPKPATQGQQPGQQRPGAPGQPQQPGQQQPGQQQPGQGQGIDIHAARDASPLPQSSIPGGAETRQGLAKPGESKEVFGQELPPSSGIGLGGGILSAAEGAAAQAAGMAAGIGTFGGASGAASDAVQMLFSLANRTAAYGAQVGGILVEGLLETALPSDSPLSNFANTLPGKLLAGVSGVRPSQPNSAGQTKPPLTSNDMGGNGGGGDTTHIGVQMNGVDIHSNNAQEFHDELSRQHTAATMQYPTHTP